MNRPGHKSCCLWPTIVLPLIMGLAWRVVCGFDRHWAGVTETRLRARRGARAAPWSWQDITGTGQRVHVRKEAWARNSNRHNQEKWQGRSTRHKKKSCTRKITKGLTTLTRAIQTARVAMLAASNIVERRRLNRLTTSEKTIFVLCQNTGKKKGEPVVHRTRSARCYI